VLWPILHYRVDLAEFTAVELAGYLRVNALFANALSAYATIQAWENQISFTVPQQIYIAINSEVGLASNASDVLALGMVVMVAIIMIGYFLLQRRAARWLR